MNATGTIAFACDVCDTALTITGSQWLGPPPGGTGSEFTGETTCPRCRTRYVFRGSHARIVLSPVQKKVLLDLPLAAEGPLRVAVDPKCTCGADEGFAKNPFAPVQWNHADGCAALTADPRRQP